MSPPQLTPTPAQVDSGDWESEFFKKNGVTDDAEKNAIRGRARVMAYDRAKQRADEAEEKRSKGDDKKPWYKE